VFCVIFGIYEKLVSSILNFFKDIKKNTLFLAPIFLGVFVGVLLFSNILKFFFENFYIPTNFAFMGLILGTLPAIIKQAAKGDGSDWQGISFAHIMCLILTLSLSVYMATLESFSGATASEFTMRIFIFSSDLSCQRALLFQVLVRQLY